MLNLTKKRLKKIKQQKLRNKENLSLISSIELKENWSWYKKWFSYKKMCTFQKIIFLIEEAKYVKELNNVFTSDYLWHQSCQKEMFKLRWLRCKIVAPAQNRALPIYSISHLIFSKQGLLEMNRFPWIAPFLKNPNVQLVLLTDPHFNFGFLKTSNHCYLFKPFGRFSQSCTACVTACTNRISFVNLSGSVSFVLLFRFLLFLWKSICF